MIWDSDLGLVIPVFDGTRNGKIARNLATTLEAVEAAGMRSFTVLAECIFADTPPLCQQYADRWCWMPIHGDRLWQKERLIQLGFEYLAAAGFSKVAYLDADFVFVSESWPTAICAALDPYVVVQNYECLIAEFEDGVTEDSGGLARWQSERRCDGRFSGGSWGYRTDFVLRYPIYQHHIVGGGDTTGMWAVTWPEHNPLSRFSQYSDALQDHLRGWVREIRSVVDPEDFGVVRLNARSLPHGTRTARRYQERHALLADFDPYSDLVAPPGQGLRWTHLARTKKMAMIQAIADYLTERDT